MVDVGSWRCFVCQLKEGVQEKAQITHPPSEIHSAWMRTDLFWHRIDRSKEALLLAAVMWSWMEAAPADFPAGVLGLGHCFWLWLGAPEPAGLELGRLRKGDGVRLVHGEASVDVGFLFALLVIWGGFQSKGVGGVRVQSQIHPLQFPLGQLLNDSCSISVAEDIDHGTESVSGTYDWALDGNFEGYGGGKHLKGCWKPTYSSQSTAIIRVTSLAGSPTAVKTITMVTSPALGTPAAPILATVAVMLLDGDSLGCQGHWTKVLFSQYRQNFKTFLCQNQC